MDSVIQTGGTDGDIIYSHLGLASCKMRIICLCCKD